MTHLVNRWTLALTAGFAAVVSGPIAMAAAGKVLAVTGVAGIDGAHARELKAGDQVEVGEVIVTRDGSSAQLLMADGSRLEVRASSHVRIDSLVLPSSIEHPEFSKRKRSPGSNVGTLMLGSLSAKSPSATGNEPSVRELHTPFGNLAVAGATYSVEMCRGDCAELTGQSGLRVVVDEGTVTFADGVRTVAVTGPSTQFISIDAAPGSVARRQISVPDESAAVTAKVPAPPLLASLDVGRANVSNRSIDAQSLLGRPVDLIDPDPPYASRISSTIVVPLLDDEWFSTSSTELSDMQSFNAAGNLVQFNAPFGASAATYLAGTSTLLDSGRNGSSGIRWGRWAGGSAMVSTVSGSEQIDLQDQSLHWIAGPTFEAPPQLAMTGETFFVLSGGTSPTDSLGNAGQLSTATLQANFTTQQVNAALSLNVNGYNWFANGSGSLVSGTPRFNGTFNTVLIDGRIPGSGAYSGFLSAGALSSDQLNGAGLSYRLTDDSGQLGSVYGVVAYVPGPPMSIVAPAVIRDVAYAVGKIDASQIAGGVASNSREQLALNSALALTRFNAPVPGAAIGGLSSGTARLVDTGASTSTGIRWGRWEGGAISVTTPPAGSQVNDLSTQSLHWIVGNEYASAPVLPQSGTATYTLVGNTTPTDTLGHTGTLGTASFVANFTTRLITSALTLKIDGVDWYASGQATYDIGNNKFEGAYDDVRIQNLVRGHGTLYGFFTRPRVASGTSSGAGLSFNLVDNTRQLGVISGVLAYGEGGAGATVTPPALQARDIAFIAPEAAAVGPQAIRAAATDYALDDNFRVVSMAGVTDSGTVDSARYDIGTSAVVTSDVSPLVMLRWGRWSGGSANVTNLASNVSHTIDLSQRSLHWIEGADAAPPIMPVTGTATYALIGGTAPTDRMGSRGILNSASLSADFTHQQVAAAIDVTVNNVNVIATGGGTIGAALGLQPHQFSGSFSAGAVSNSAATPQGSFSGFFTSPGGTQSNVPGGAGLTYTVGDGQNLNIDGAAAFRNQ